MGLNEDRKVGEKQKRPDWDTRQKQKRFMKKVETTKDRTIGVKRRGILVTCGTRQESQCTKESILLFSEYAEKLQPGLFDTEDQSEVVDKNKGLENELAQLRTKAKGSGAVFTKSEAGVHGTVFVRFERENMDPVEVVSSILEDVQRTGLSNCRYAVRFIPVQDSCYAKPDEAAEMCERLSKTALPPVPEDIEPEKQPTYAIVIRKSNNSGVHREDYINKIAAKMPKGYKVNLTKPEWVLVVEIMRNTCCAAFVKKYYELGKFNIQTVVERFHGPGSTTKSKPEEAATNGESKPAASAEGEEPKQKSGEEEKPEGGEKDVEAEAVDGKAGEAAAEPGKSETEQDTKGKGDDEGEKEKPEGENPKGEAGEAGEAEEAAQPDSGKAAE